MTELLSPAGDFECALAALYSGADAIYCATQRFGARAYAKNLTIEELEKLLALAHALHKKIYVTVNTIIKEKEWDDCILYIQELYKIGVDGLILADYGLIDYVLQNLPQIEAHISTQAGVKNLSDVLYFEKIGAARVVLARENTLEEIQFIKKNSTIPLEVFAHGALCVSYSGGCLLSSMLSLRSGNRGRCSQNCRREYTLYKDGKMLGEKGFYLSMKDLNSSSIIPQLVSLNIDSLKLEGRMKNKEYVQIITSEYRKMIDQKGYTATALHTIFHRPYTGGFLQNTDSRMIVDPTKKGNEGQLIGHIGSNKGTMTEVFIYDSLHIKDRIRIEMPEEDYYFTIDQIYDEKGHPSSKNTGSLYLQIYKKIMKNAKIYKMIDSKMELTIANTYKRAIDITVLGQENEPLTLTTTLDGTSFVGQSKELLSKAISKPLSDEILLKQINRIKETSFYLRTLENKLIGNLFISVAAMNEARRNLLESIDNFYQNKRVLLNTPQKSPQLSCKKYEQKLVAYCTTKEQFEACKKAKINSIYFQNVAPYVAKSYPICHESEVLIGDYGALERYQDKLKIADYSFNVINSNAVYGLLKAGADIVTLSLESSLEDVKSISETFTRQNQKVPLEMLVYGKVNLMTMKYCPLKRFNECGDCQNHHYTLKDDISEFDLLHQGCITHLLNAKATNLIDDLPTLMPYITRFRLQFTTESFAETLRIIEQFQYRWQHLDTQEKFFDSKHNTRGYFKRSIQ